MAVIRLDAVPDVIEGIANAMHETAAALIQAAEALHASADRLIEAATRVRTVAEEPPGLTVETEN